MCSNYKPVTLQDRLLAHFGVARPDTEEPPEFALPGFVAPFLIRDAHKQELQRECRLGLYGLLPDWAPDLAFGRNTYNCRTESMRQKPAFKKAWHTGHRCLVPVELLYEFCYETGEPVRWAIKLSTGGPMGVAGLWGIWPDPRGVDQLSFTMLTVNADGHGIFGRMHPPGDEKRMPVILHPRDYDGWLNGPNEDAASYIAAFPAELLESYPEPTPWKELQEPSSWSSAPDMFEAEWRAAATDPVARQLKCRRARSKPKVPRDQDPPMPMSDDLF